MLKISYVVVILIILILHTGITHLINWWFRKLPDSCHGEEIFPVIVQLSEFGLIFIWLNHVIKSLQ